MFRKRKKNTKEENQLNSPAALAKELTKDKRKDREKCWAIFNWIAHNIAYDVDSLFSNSFENQDPEHVFKTGRSVCGGFANLFTAMAKEDGLEAVTVHGYAKGFGYKPGDQVKKTNPITHGMPLKLRINGS